MDFAAALAELDSIYFSEFMNELAKGTLLSKEDIRKQNYCRFKEYITNYTNSQSSYDFSEQVKKYPFIKRFREKVIRDDIENLNAWNVKVSKIKLRDSFVNILFHDYTDLLIKNQQECFEKLFHSLNCEVIENNKESVVAELNYTSKSFAPRIFIDASSTMKPKNFSTFCNISFLKDIEPSINLDLGGLHYALEFLKVSPPRDEFSNFEYQSLELYNIVMSVLVFKVFCTTILPELELSRR